MTTEASPIRTEHPHIVRMAGVCSGEPIIEGTRISVILVVRRFQAGDQPLEIVEALPHLTPAAVYDAISYYHDHKQEIDAAIRANTPEELAARYGFEVSEHGRVSFGRD